MHFRHFIQKFPSLSLSFIDKMSKKGSFVFDFDISSPETTAERKARKTLVENLRMIFLLLICMAQWRPANRTNSAVAPTCTREHTPAILRYTEQGKG